MEKPEKTGNDSRQLRKGAMARSSQMHVREAGTEGSEGEMWVEGYAATFDSETVLFELDGIEYKEMICEGAFDGCKMEDVIFNYNHGGKVMARTRNGTLQLSIDDKGLHIRARLDGTEEGRRLYEEIKGGYIDRMSFAFTIREESYDKDSHLWKIHAVKRLYDVSAVDIPAYDDTSIEARKDFILEAEAQEKRERKAEAELRKRKLVAAIKLSI